MLSGGRLTTKLSGEAIFSTTQQTGSITRLGSWRFGTGTAQNLFVQGRSNVVGTKQLSLSDNDF